MLAGSNGGIAPASEDGIARLWHDPVLGPDLRALGLEAPDQLGALFLADAAGLARLAGDAPPVDDDHPSRISPHAPSHSQTLPVFQSWMDETRAREAFSASEWVRRVWPAGLRQRTLARFRQQRLVNQRLLATSFGNRNTIDDLHDLLVGSELRSLPLWLLFSDADEQRLASAAAARGERSPAIEYALGLGDLAERRFDSAAERFARVEQNGGSLASTVDAPFQRVFALCLAGRRAEAAAAMRRLQARNPGAAAEFFDAMARLCVP
jgi:hypothetical protein